MARANERVTNPNRTRDGDQRGREESQNIVLSKLRITDPRVDPSHAAFDFDRWSQTVARLRAELGVISPPRSGCVFRRLTVRGSASPIRYQDTVWTALVSLFDFSKLWRGAVQTKTILHNLDGVLQKGELLLVLGMPGSGCTTFLKAITGQTSGLDIDSETVIEYRGIPYNTMKSRFKGDLVYTQESDQHFPHLTVAQTLEFAGAMRTPRNRLPGLSRTDRVRHVVEVMLVAFGLFHVRDTIVGDDHVRGVSGGERKRVTIAEAALAEVAVSAWDNPTRGLDSASALNFVHRLRTLSDLASSCVAAAIYQSSQAIFDRFDKVLVLDQGRQIFFGPAESACSYFEQMGWQRHPRQTSAEFLTAVTDPARRQVRPGFEEELMPATPEEFEKRWRESAAYELLQGEMSLYQAEWNSGGNTSATRQREMDLGRKQVKQRFMLSRAPQTVSFFTQIKLCAARSCRQLWNDRASTLTALGGEVVIAVVVGSIFYQTPDTTTDSLFSFGSLLFFSVLLNVLLAMTDIHGVYGRRSVVQKHVSWALYRPSADALATVLIDAPVKFCLATCFNLILYFMTGLGPTASQFFIFFLFVFTTTMAMSMVFRTIAAATKTLVQALAVSGFLVLTLVTYAGFVLPVPSMPPWFAWISYINPLAYAFGSLLVNQAHGALYHCANNLVPPYPDLAGDTFICTIPGSVAGETHVSGDGWLEQTYGYSYSHLWRNLGILLGFIFFFLVAYIVASEVNDESNTMSDSGVPVFLRQGGRSSHAGRLSSILKGKVKGKGRAAAAAAAAHDVEALAATSNNTVTTPSLLSVTAGKGLNGNSPPRPEIPRRQLRATTFSFRNICLDVETKDGSRRRLLDNVSGRVQPGTLTALMGVSGAGKTTLLNALAQRLPRRNSPQGEFLLGSTPIVPSKFRRDVAYVQQQDVHLATSTVREALQFSAMLRQGAEVPTRDKLAYAEDVMDRLGMRDFADAVVGTPGEGGLSLEQRKRLSIGVELAAKPPVLLFLDEPTSGMDSQSSENIVALLRKLASADDGLAILCTIHQPSAMLFQQFDRLLLMAHGGRTVYFGDIGANSGQVLDYFYRHGRVRRCAAAENPAEYLLDVVQAANTAAPPANKSADWPGAWTESVEARHVSAELDGLKQQPQPQQGNHAEDTTSPTTGGYHHAVPLHAQFPVVYRRVVQYYWRSPDYIFSKLLLGIPCSLLVGFSFFQVDASIAETQNAIFSVLLICATFSSLVQQVLPKFLHQLTLYHVRERHSTTYAWPTLLLSNTLAELPCNLVLGILSFAAYYPAVFGTTPAPPPENPALVLLFLTHFYVLAGTFAHLVMAPLRDTATAGRLTTVLFSMMILFAGVFQPPADLGEFWIFMYRVSPLTYLVGGAAVAGLGGEREIVCSEREVAVFQPSEPGQTCAAYLQAYLDGGAPGRLLNPEATADCAYCPLRSASQVLAGFGMFYEDRWFDWVVGIAYVVFNIVFMFVLYYLFRVRRWGKWVGKLQAAWQARRKSVSATT